MIEFGLMIMFIGIGFAVLFYGASFALNKKDFE